MNVYIFGEFNDELGRAHQLRVFRDSAVDTIIEFNNFQPDGVTIIHEQEDLNDQFGRVVFSKALVNFIAETQPQREALFKMSIDDETYYFELTRNGTGVIYQGRVYQDLGFEQNESNPVVFTVEVRDGLKELFGRSAREMSSDPIVINLPTLPNLTFRFPRNIPTLFNDALKLLRVQDYSDYRLTSAYLWTNEVTRDNGYNINQNYLAQHFLEVDNCFIKGKDEERKYRGAGLYNRAEDTYDVREVVQYYTIGEVLQSLLECFDLILMYDRGKFRLIQRGLIDTASYRQFEYTDSYTFTDSAPAFGAIDVGTVSNIQVLNDAWRGDAFGGLPKAWSIKHLFVNPVEPVFGGAVRTRGLAAPQGNPYLRAPGFLFNPATNVGNEIDYFPATVINNITTSSFDLLKFNFDLEVRTDWFRSPTQPNGTQIRVRAIFTNSITNQEFYSINIATFYRQSGVGFAIYEIKKSVVTPMPSNTTPEDIVCKLDIEGFPKFVFANGQISQVLGAVTDVQIFGGIEATGVIDSDSQGAFEFIGYNERNENEQFNIDRGRLLYENINGNLAGFRIGSKPLGANITFTQQTEWRYFNNAPNRLLNQLRTFEMLTQVQRVQGRLDFRMKRFDTPVWHRYDYDNRKWRWTRKEWEVATGFVSGVLVEVFRTSNDIIINDQVQALEQERGVLTPEDSSIDPSIFGFLQNGRLIQSADIAAGTEINELELTGVERPITVGATVGLVDAGQLVLRVEATSVTEEAGVTTVGFDSVILEQALGDGVQVMTMSGAASDGRLIVVEATDDKVVITSAFHNSLVILDGNEDVELSSGAIEGTKVIVYNPAPTAIPIVNTTFSNNNPANFEGRTSYTFVKSEIGWVVVSIL